MAIKFLNQVDVSGTAYLNGANNNSGKADFAVKAVGSTTDVSLSLRNGQFQVGNTDMNYEARLDSFSSDVVLRSWARNLKFTTDSSTTSHYISFTTTNAGTETERMRITSTGNIGIGTTSPTATLHVDGSSGATATFRGATQSTVNLEANTVDNYIVGTTSGTLSLRPAGTERLRVDSNGIKIAADAKLATTNNNLNFIELYNGSDASMFFRMGHSTVGRFGFLNSSNTEVFTIDPRNERVGIGTTSPSTKLHVEGNTPVLQLRETGGNNEVGISLNHSVSGNHYNWFIGTLDGSARKLTIGAEVKNGHGTSTAQSAASLMIINQDGGKVGIGVSDPATKLHVNGTVRVNNEVQFTNDQMRIYRSSNDMRLRTGSSDRMTIAGGGNVGIGTTSPEEKLHVSSGNNSNVSVLVGQSTAYGDGSIRFKTASTNYMGIGFTSGTSASDNVIDAIVIQRTGNVGIGDTTPSEKLEVNGSVKIGNVKIQNANGGRIGLNRNTSTGAIYNSSYGAFQIQNNFASADIFEIQSYTSSGSYSGVISMKAADGKVGIGTTAPSRKLHVTDTNPQLRLSYSSASDARYADVSWYGMQVNSSNSTSNNFHITMNGGNASSGAIILSTGENGSSAERMRITRSGNIGIGTTSPSVKLDVVGGNIRKSSDANNYSQMGAGGSGGFINGYSGGSENFIIRSYANSGVQAYFTAGNIGIGTTSPEEKLSIGSGKIQLENNQELTWSDIGDGNTGRVAIRGSEDSDIILFRVDNSERMRLTTTGLGIGTTTTESKLTVVGSGGVGDAAITSKYSNSSVLGEVSTIAHRNSQWSTLYVSESGSSATNAVFVEGTKPVIFNAGTVGIGITTPVTNYKLHVDGTGRPALFDSTNAVSTVKIANNSTGNGTYNGLDFSVNSTSNNNINSYGMPLTFGTSSTNGTSVTERMRITSDGKVGIGTTSPSKDFDVNGTARVGGELFFSHFDATGANSRFRDNLRLYFGTSRVFNLHYDSTGDDLRIASGSTAIMTFDDSNNVGIGTTSPGEKLEVAGKGVIRKSGTATPHADTDFLVTDATAALSTAQMEILGGNNGSSNIYFSDPDSYNSGGIQYSHSADSMNLRTNGSTKITIESGGNVGIGTTSPSQKLNVSGNIQSTGNVYVGDSVYVANSIYHSGDTNTYIKFDADRVRIYAGGTSKFDTNDSVMQQSTADLRYLQLSGGTMTGNLTVSKSSATVKVIESGGGDLRMTAGGATGYIGTYNNNSLQILQNGSTAIFVDTSRNVGIGTTSPDSELHIAGSTPFLTVRGTDSSYSNAGIQLISGHASNNRALGVFHYVENSDVEWFAGLPYSGNDAYVINRNTGYTVPSSQSSPPGKGASEGRLLTINSSGNVGIGTTTPSQKLHVNGNARVSQDLYVGGQILHDDDTNTRIVFSNDDITFRAGDVVMLTINENGTQDKVVINSSGNDVDFRVEGSSDENLLFTEASTDRVGIGTNDPDAKLHVEGSAFFNVYTNNGTSGGLFFRDGYVESSKYNLSITTYDQGGSGTGSMDSLDINAYDGIAFNTGSNSRNERMRIKGNGNVGIGTTSPAEKLDVNGNIKAAKGAGIYVFNDTVDSDSSEDIFKLSNTHGAQAFRVTFVCSTSGYSVAKTFEVVHQYGEDPIFAKVIDTGVFSGHDFDVAFADVSSTGVKATITNNSTTKNANIVTTVFLGGSPTDITVTAL